MQAGTEFGESAMIETDFNKLLTRVEDDTLDFKEEMYDLAGDGRVDLLKDVISMANTPRTVPAYLVCGVEWKPGSPARPIGMASQIDDVRLHEQLTSDEISPAPPAFTYHPLLIGGRHFGVVEIRPEPGVGPFYPTKDRGNKLLRDVLYVRSGGGNARANREQTRKVHQWFGRVSPLGGDATADQWNRFLDATDDLDDARQYLLIIDVAPDPAGCAGLGQIPWLAVVDFDPSSESKGILQSTRPGLQQSRTVQLAVKGDRPPIHTRNQTVWYFARGLIGRHGTEVGSEPKQWIRQYGKELDEFLEHLARATSPSPTTVISLWHEPSTTKLMTTVLDAILKSFGDAARIVAVTSDPKIEEAVAAYDAVTVALDARTLSQGVTHVLTRRRDAIGDAALPTPSGTPCPLTEKDRSWLEEELELAHLDAWRDGPDRPEPFRRGEVVTWRDLDLHHDCDRSITGAISERVRADLKDRALTRISLYHPPGAGGTTVARRLVWDIHAHFPTVVLRHLVPEQTAARLTRIAALTQSAVLCLVDGGQHRDGEIDELYSLLRGQQTSVVLLQVLRRFQKQKLAVAAAGVPQRAFWLPLELDVAETERFRAAYSQAVPSRSKLFDGIAKSSDAKVRTAFYFGLSAYGRDFHGLPNYVNSRVSSLSDVQRRIVGFLALSHHYGQQPIPAQCFAPLLGLPRDRAVDLPGCLTPEAAELIIQTDEKSWRTAHNLIAEELLKQLLTPPQAPEADAWKQQLSTWAVDFARMLHGDWQTPGEQLIDLAARVFVVRENSELLGTESSVQPRFAQLIEDIPSVHGRMEVLERLAQFFPAEAHFHAHLGRFCGLNGRYVEAMNAIDQALELSPNDSVLHHMRGMTLRYQIREKMDKSVPLVEVVAMARDAQEAFIKSRELSPDNEHGYVSEVQLLVRVLDYAARQAKADATALVYSSAADPFLREAMDAAEDLMYQLREKRGGDRASDYELDCRAKLDALYGDHQKALQGWESLLSRQGTMKPPVRRQIVWTLLHRTAGSWAKMRTKDADRCRDLLQENLADQPGDAASIRLWLQAVRHSCDPPSLNTLIERVSYWKSNSGSLEAAFYLFVLHSLAAFEGSTISREDAMRALEDCRGLARFRQKRTWSYEWVGTGQGIRGLVHQTDLGEWVGDFFKNTSLLARVKGRVAELNAPQQGRIELEGGLLAFFVPTVAGLQPGRDENRQVDCYVGFSYDGLRAWQVQAA